MPANRKKRAEQECGPSGLRLHEQPRVAVGRPAGEALRASALGVEDTPARAPCRRARGRRGRPSRSPARRRRGASRSRNIRACCGKSASDEVPISQYPSRGSIVLRWRLPATTAATRGAASSAASAASPPSDDSSGLWAKTTTQRSPAPQLRAQPRQLARRSRRRASRPPRFAVSSTIPRTPRRRRTRSRAGPARRASRPRRPPAATTSLARAPGAGARGSAGTVSARPNTSPWRSSTSTAVGGARPRRRRRQERRGRSR